mmetsp:Transcript_26681/g.91135  ORF Transcript_26681/g.91135 Transcript_26681/m.91135 type:complete len:309 (+) Transcript_26681:254-1180(+)
MNSSFALRRSATLWFLTFCAFSFTCSYVRLSTCAVACLCTRALSAPFRSSRNLVSSTLPALAACCSCRNLISFCSACRRRCSARSAARFSSSRACSSSWPASARSRSAFFDSASAFTLASFRVAACAAARSRTREMFCTLACSVLCCSTFFLRMSCRRFSSSCAARALAVAMRSRSSASDISSSRPCPGVEVESNSSTRCVGTFSSALSCRTRSILRWCSSSFSSATWRLASWRSRTRSTARSFFSTATDSFACSTPARASTTCSRFWRFASTCSLSSSSRFSSSALVCTRCALATTRFSASFASRAR